MGLFNLFSKKSTGPYKEEHLNVIYNLLFCDNIALYKSTTKNPVYPWDVLLVETPDNESLVKITSEKTLEARQRMLAYHLLAASGIPAGQKEILGVIVEVGLADGLDVLAAFSDGTARYLNYTSKLLLWETRTKESDELIGRLFSAGANVVHKIGPWDKERKPFPTKGMVRLSFLVSDGLYFGEGPMEVLQSDPMGGPVIHAAIMLMTYLTQQPVP